MTERMVIGALAAEFARYRRLAEAAVEQITWEQMRAALDGEVNSIAVIMKHVAGNLRSRWMEPLTSDGEKPWRERDREFVDDLADRAALTAAWNAGWGVLERELGAMRDADLGRELRIRGEPHTLALALARSLAHVAYHSGQIVLLARHAAEVSGRAWRTLTIARGGSRAHNEAMGFAAARRDEARPGGAAGAGETAT